MSVASRLRSALIALAGEEKKTIRVEPFGHPAERYHPLYLSEEYALSTVDDLVSKKGITVYREMMQRDDQVAACVRLMQFSRLSTGHEITPASETEGLDVEVCDYVMQNLRDLRECSVNALLLDSMDAFVAGFSLSEKIWGDPLPGGDFAGKQGYRTFRPIPQETVTIKRDKFGQIEPDGVWQAKEDRHIVVASLDPSQFNKLPRDRFVLWSWLSQWGNPLGISLLRPAYRWYLIKDLLIRSWAKHVERFGLPLIDLEAPNDVTDSVLIALEEKLRNFATGGALAHRSNHKLTITPLGAQAAPTYQPLLAECNRGISRSILTPATLFDQPEVGAYSLGESQKSVWIAIQDNLGDALADRVMMEQVIRPLVEHNYGPDVDLPKFAFKPMSQTDLVKIVTAATMLADRGFPVPHKWVEREAGIPAAQPGENALGPSVASGPGDQLPPDILSQTSHIDELQEAAMRALSDRSGKKLGDFFGVKTRGNGGGI